LIDKNQFLNNFLIAYNFNFIREIYFCNNKIIGFNCKLNCFQCPLFKYCKIINKLPYEKYKEKISELLDFEILNNIKYKKQKC